MTTKLLYYLAYGSNLHPIRLIERVRSAQFISTIRMEGRQLAFHKRSVDGSGKCMFYETGNATDLVYAGVYQFDSAERAELDRLEGVGHGYTAEVATVNVASRFYSAFIYVAQTSHISATLAPYGWYKEMVLLGGEFHQLPTHYLAAIESVPVIADPDKKRESKQLALVSQMRFSNDRKGRS